MIGVLKRVLLRNLLRRLRDYSSWFKLNKGCTMSVIFMRMITNSTSQTPIVRTGVICPMAILDLIECSMCWNKESDASSYSYFYFHFTSKSNCLIFIHQLINNIINNLVVFCTLWYDFLINFWQWFSLYCLVLWCLLLWYLHLIMTSYI